MGGPSGYSEDPKSLEETQVEDKVEVKAEAETKTEDCCCDCSCKEESGE